MIEFSSPNIVREFEGKHLRSTILGSHIAKLYGSMGWDVVKINYLGDWGKPIGLLGVGWEKFGSEELFESDPAGHLLDVYHKIDDMLEVERVARKKARDEGKDTTEFESQGLFAEQNAFLKRMEDGEETAVTFSERVRTVNIEDYSKLYGRLNVSFDDYSGESQASQEVMTEVEEILRSKGLCEESGHSLTIDLKKHGGKSGTAKIRDTSGSSTYLLRDLAGVLSRARKYSFDKMIYVVAADNADHFSQVFKVLELMDMHDLASKLQHIQFSKVSEMSKRLGRGHMLGEILDQCKVAMWKSLETNPEKAAPFSTTKDAAAAIGISALLAQEVSATRSKNHAFDISRMTSFEPGTGPNLQYWYARLRAGLKGASCNGDHSNEDLTSIQQKDHVALLRLLAMYPDVTRIAYDKLEPATIMAYLSNVTGYLSSCLGAVDQGNAFDQAQILLFEAARIVLENGMELVGITPATG